MIKKVSFEKLNMMAFKFHMKTHSFLSEFYNTFKCKESLLSSVKITTTWRLQVKYFWIHK